MKLPQWFMDWRTANDKDLALRYALHIAEFGPVNGERPTYEAWELAYVSALHRHKQRPMLRRVTWHNVGWHFRRVMRPWITLGVAIKNADWVTVKALFQFEVKVQIGFRNERECLEIIKREAWRTGVENYVEPPLAKTHYILMNLARVA